MQVLADLDPRLLEEHLLDRLEELQAAGTTARTLVLVPSSALAGHLQRSMARRREAWIGVDVMNFRASAMHVMQVHGQAPKQVASARLFDALLLRLLGRLPRNEWSEIVRQRPGTLRRLRGSLQELREAGIGPDQLRRQLVHSGRNPALHEVYEEYSRALAKLADAGLVDDAGLIATALPLLTTHLQGYAAAFVHGIYELIGCHVDWIRGIDATTPVTMLLPCAPGTRVSQFSETFATEQLISEGQSLQAIPNGTDGKTRPALAALYDEEARPERSGCPFRFHHAQGQAAEARHAVRQALAAIRDGCPPSEIVIAARSLEPYAAAIEEAFDEFALPWSSPLSSPLRRHPVIRDFLLLLEVLDEDFPREATAEFLRSRRFRWHELGSSPADPQGDRADAWSRSAGILGGIEEWTRDLPLWAEQIRHRSAGSDRGPAEQAAERQGRAARQIADALSALARQRWDSAGSWHEHADKLEALRRLLLPLQPEPLALEAHDSLHDILDEMRGMDRLPDRPARIRFAEMRTWLERAVEESALRLRGPDDGGIRVLDVMQLRGLTFRRLFLLGMNAGFFPASGAEDPILRDADRTRLRRRTGRPIPLHGQRIDEERLLLATTLGCASEAIDVSWQRSDESGRGKTPSLALREVARLALGRPDMTALFTPETHLPSHPTHALDQAVATAGLLTPCERQLLDALHLQGLDSLAAFARIHPDLERGALMLRSTQSFSVGDADYDPSYDARVGRRESDGSFSVSALENLGRCPLRFFFAHVLRVREMDEAADLFEVTSREMGLRLHDALERVYRELMTNGADWSDAASLEARALPLLEREREQILGQFGTRLQRRLPVLYDHVTDDWIARLRGFVQADLRWIAEHGWQPAGFEESLEVELEFAATRATIRGRVDRRMTRGEEQLISDYKTSSRPENKISVTEALRGLALQVPLYWTMLGGQQVELLNIGPGFDPQTYRHRFPGLDPAQARGFAETMNALLDLERDGVFPLRPDNHCNWCAYRAACRRTHPPTIEREQQFSDSRDFRRLRKKTPKLPRFADLQGKRR